MAILQLLFRKKKYMYIESMSLFMCIKLRFFNFFVLYILYVHLIFITLCVGSSRKCSYSYPASATRDPRRVAWEGPSKTKTDQRRRGQGVLEKNPFWWEAWIFSGRTHYWNSVYNLCVEITSK